MRKGSAKAGLYKGDSMQYFQAHDIRDYKDMNGNVPEILLVDGNRAAGKTTAFSSKFVRDYLEHGKKFMLIYRYGNELRDIAESFFKDIRALFFPDHTMIDRSRANGAYIELFLDNKSCGYAVALNTAAKLKHYSHIFSDVEQMLFDEYQLESGFYIPDEIKKFVSLHMTVARGRGAVVRFVPVYMLSNSISIFNPYYDAFGIARRINSNTKQLRGDGWVLLRLTLKEVAKAQEESAFNRAFANSSYVKAATDNSFLNDETFNIEKRSVAGFEPEFMFADGSKTYACFGRLQDFHIKKSGIIPNVPIFGVRQSDRNGEYRSIRHSNIFARIQAYYANGYITFQDTESKAAFMSLIFENL